MTAQKLHDLERADVKVHDLVSQLTLEEKVSSVLQCSISPLLSRKFFFLYFFHLNPLERLSSSVRKVLESSRLYPCAALGSCGVVIMRHFKRVRNAAYAAGLRQGSTRPQPCPLDGGI